MKPIQSPRGAHDILPPTTDRWRRFEADFAAACARAGYGELRLPMFEELEVFRRLGEGTDVVSKQMYSFTDPDGQQMALRPEMTASAARSFIQHSPVVPWKVFYLGPQFRSERPQAGRYRQFSQAGVEAFGVSDPHLDVEAIALGWEFLKSLGLRQLELQLNSLGEPSCRERYGQQLREYLSGRAGELSEDSKVTLEKNPMRVLDSKRRQDQPVIAGAPSCQDVLSDESSERFAQVCDGLDALGIPFQINPRLVRGLDYYTHTAFEYVSLAFKGSQNALGGGGHYGGLVEALGGKPCAGVGFALGIDRILLAADAEGTYEVATPGLDVFVVDVAGGGEAMALTHQLRAAGFSCDRTWAGRSMKAQMKAADRSGAQVAVIVGPQELEMGVVALRDLRRDDGFDGESDQPRDVAQQSELAQQDETAQQNVSREDLLAVLADKLADHHERNQTDD